MREWGGRSRAKALGRVLVLALALPGLVAGCGRARAAAPVPQAQLEEQLKGADRAFAVATAARGLEGWMSFMATDVVRMTRMADPVRGYDAVRKADSASFSNPSVKLVWEPTDAGAFADGGQGWTVGHYEVRRRAPDGSESVAARGRYITLWRRAEDGRWLVILDTGAPDR